MKKQNLAALAMAFASFGAIGTPNTAPNNVTQQQRHNDAIDKKIAPAPRQSLKELTPSGGNSFMSNKGTPPKEYGMWLQMTGRQKWVKSKKH